MKTELEGRTMERLRGPHPDPLPSDGRGNSDWMGAVICKRILRYAVLGDLKTCSRTSTRTRMSGGRWLGKMGTRGTRPSDDFCATPFGVGSLFLHTAGCTCGYSCCCPSDSGILRTRHRGRPRFFRPCGTFCALVRFPSHEWLGYLQQKEGA